MRPYPDELLRSINRSLTEVIIPNIGDDWARYVARSMEKMISHLELRYKHELEYLATDTAELDALLRELRPALDQGDLADRRELDAVEDHARRAPGQRYTTAARARRGRPERDERGLPWHAASGDREPGDGSLGRRAEGAARAAP